MRHADQNLSGYVLWEDTKIIDLRRADLSGADLSGARGVSSFGPIGEMGRVCYAYINNGVQLRIGCFNGDHNQAIEAIRAKCGEHSNYEMMLRAAVWALADQKD